MSPDGRSAPVALTASATESATKTSASRRTRIMPLHLDVDDSLDDEGAGDDHHSGDEQRDLPAGAGPHGADDVGLKRVEREAGDDRQGGQDPPAHATLRGECPDEPPDVGTLAHGGDDHVEDLRRV